MPTKCDSSLPIILESTPAKVTDEAHLSDDLGVDWLDQLELLVLIEDEFVGVEFSDVTAIEVVGDLIRHMEKARHVVSVHRRSAA